MYFTSASSRLLLYDSSTWDFKKSYGCYDGILRDISWSDDSKYMLQVNSKGLVEILTAADHDVRSLQHVPLKDSWSACFHRDGHRSVAIGTRSGNVLIWDTKIKNITKTFPTPAHPSPVSHVSYNLKNTHLAASMLNGDTVIYSVISNIPLLTMKLNLSKSISSMKFHQESRSLIGLAVDEGHVILRDVSTNKDKAVFENIHAAPVSDIAFSLINKDVMFSTGYDKNTHIYDIRLQNVVSTVKTQYTLTTLAVNHENNVAIGTKNGLVLIYDLRDLYNPFKVLKSNEEEISKVAFQPLRKKQLSADISLREDMDHLSPLKMTSPVRTRTSDMFLFTDSPPKILESPNQMGDVKADSFLVMMGLDKSHNDLDDNVNRTVDNERKSDKLEVRFRQLDTEKNMSKVSTPLTNRTGDNLVFPSPLIMNGVADENIKIDIKQTTNQIDMKSMDELKDFVKLSLSDVADDNRNYFLHIMMALTKQKLYLEKQLTNMNEQMKTLVQNQNTLVEMNRRLTLEVDQLKSRQHFF
ncbi:hypothetical protein K1T71_010060 [Dendrolimus kikuchii]|uniref:Uncharacterized protein n=1 Tax=Dendrolimus kikuchii TaxID=765133 RepID=A0ACC1CQL7_9NEOP|nr:hypothetical protein K1T71_010060 [Dendrolimus kikuchii]